MRYCQIDDDRWDHAGKTYMVLRYENNLETTGVKMTVEDVFTHKVDTFTVPSHSIIWIG